MTKHRLRKATVATNAANTLRASFQHPPAQQHSINWASIIGIFCEIHIHIHAYIPSFSDISIPGITNATVTTVMTDITPLVRELLKAHGTRVTQPRSKSGEEQRPSTETVDEFLKEAYRINAHITSLLTYLKSIRQSYLSTSPRSHFSQNTHPHRRHSTTTSLQQPPDQKQQTLTDTDRDTIDSSTALVLRDLSSSISNLASAETLRQETQSTLLRKKFGLDYKNSALWKWAAGGSQVEKSAGTGSAEQARLEETERTLKTVRENVLWWLRRRLEGVAEVQRGMVEKRIERVREKEKSILYKMSGVAGIGAGVGGVGAGSEGGSFPMRDRVAGAADVPPDMIDEKEKAEIESKLSPEQLQLFAQENEGLLKHYEDTLGKVKNAEKSLLEISSLQQTLVMHLSTQEDFINQLVSDAASTEANVGQANKDLKRATERRSTAQAVFWGTVGLCTWLIIWDAIF
ncbi:SNARE protein [Blastomyces dermatitidis ER-3]|uniref:SNARE protein n=1 Tax=Ajellomyces dermatitidis (strain ER-3 / ATCC MYA-2586) TaxID=559297 RepID=A0ABP2F4U2_AJEDR|nr:SNARE protein [Blastomyces dermatitidis ER-3]EEQ92026.2 SNARE protein [Blastomyces dermatitidis ER-3]EQL28130.1 hypothetical protein BDFG_09095 [Blastomyces dermatitidis ATCC 26199]